MTHPTSTSPTTTDLSGTPDVAEQRGPGRRHGWRARPIGGQPAWEPEALERFVAAPRIALLSYVRADGRPGQAPLWYVVHDGALVANVGTGSPKHRALRRDPRVTVTVQDERPPYRAVTFDAVAELVDRPQRAATEGIEQRYFGRIGGAAYRRMLAESGQEPDGFTEITLVPRDLRGFDNTVGLHPLTVAFLRLRPRLPLLRRLL